MDAAIVAQFAVATLLPVVASIVLWLLRKRTTVAKVPEKAWQLIVGLVFGAIAIYGTEAGIPLDGAMMNVRDAAPIAAGLFFGGPAGIIAGLIGGVERWFSVLWGVGAFTQVACSLGTIFAGIYAALLRRFMFDSRIPSWPMALVTGTVVEVLHLLLVFLTNLDQTSRAFAVVQACVLPMVGCVSISVGLAAFILALLNGYRPFAPREARGVAQIVQSNLLVAVVVAFFITVGFTSIVQMNLARSEAEALLTLNIDDVEQDILDASDAAMISLTQRAVAHIPEVDASTNEECTRLAEDLGVAEVNVFDKNGFVVSSNIPEYVGFDITTGDQSKEFMVLLSDDGPHELVQDYRPSANDSNIWRKYAAMVTGGGFVQVGYDADNFTDDFAVQVKAAVRNRHIGKTGGLGVVDSNGAIITGSQATTTSAADVLAPEAADRLAADAAAAGAGNLFITSFNDEECYAMYDQVEGYNIMGILPAAEAHASRDVATLITSLMEILIFALLFLVMYFAIKRVVVRNIWQVNGRLGQITQGDLDVEVDVRATTEFASLSDDINKTVGVLKDSLETVQSDLDMAADIQANTLPRMSPEIASLGSFKLHASMEPAKEVGGDFYDFFMIDDDHLAMVVADVSGKGVPAALFMMKSKTVIKMEALSGLSPDEVLYQANIDLSEKNDDDMFTTVWLGILEISTGKLVFADAGHEKLALYRNGVWEMPPKPNGAVALGPFKKKDYDKLADKYRFRTCTIQLKPGDALFQYSDGVTEANDENEELFGEDCLMQALEDAPNANPEELLAFVRTRIGEFVGDADQFDDITMLGLLYLGSAHGEMEIANDKH